MSTDPRIAIVRRWAVERARVDRPFGMPDTATGHYAELLSRLDALPSSSGEELVERVAAAIYVAKHGERCAWPNVPDEKKDDFRRYARAALKALPPSGALGLAREILTGLGWFGAGNEAIRAVREKARALVAMLGGGK